MPGGGLSKPDTNFGDHILGKKRKEKKNFGSITNGIPYLVFSFILMIIHSKNLIS